MRALVSAILLSLSACGGPEPTPPTPSPPAAPERPAARRGLWVLAEGAHRTLEDPARIDALLQHAQTLGVTDLFVQVYRSGRSWFPSSHADDAPARALVEAGHGDALPRLLGDAHASGLRVHAWFNALSVHTNREAPLLRSAGRAAVLVDRVGRSLLDYPRFDVPPPDRTWTRLGSPGVWLDPAVPGVIEALEGVVDDLVRAAPELDGLHLDYIRHPLALPIVPGSRFDGLDFGYGEASVARFESETGKPFRRGDAWDEFRRARVSETVRRLCARLPEDWEGSAAVLPWADRAYLSAMQDWRRWLEEGWIDFAVAMAYMRDDRLLRYVSDGLVGGTAGERVWIGLGSWLFVREPERIRAQARIALASEPSGIAFFSYDSLVASPAALAAIGETAGAVEGAAE